MKTDQKDKIKLRTFKTSRHRRQMIVLMRKMMMSMTRMLRMTKTHREDKKSNWETLRVPEQPARVSSMMKR